MRAAGREKCVLALRVTLLLSLLTAATSETVAERLPSKIYTTADGLARDRVMRVVRDSRGFLWFCTDEGLSRFDGYQFTNYTTADGLPHPIVWDFLETRGGDFWVATWGGLARFDPAGTPRTRGKSAAGDGPKDSMFVVYRPPEKSAWSFKRLYEDRAGNVWGGTQNGLYRVERAGGDWKLQFVDIGAPREAPDSSSVFNLLEDRRGALWIATADGLYRRRPDGETERYDTRHGLPSNIIRGLLEDPDGTLWVGTSAGLCRLRSEAGPHQLIVERVYHHHDGLTGSWINWLFRSSDGRFWVGTDAGLAEAVSGVNEEGLKFRTYTRAHGLSDPFTWAMTEDRHGNLWVGTNLGGAIKLARNGFTTWREEDGLIASFNNSIGETADGEVYLTGVSPNGRFLNLFDGGRVTPVRINLPESVTDFGGETHQNSLQDHLGEWWIPTEQGLFRFPKVTGVGRLTHARPKAVYTARDGLGGDAVYRLFEDRRGDIWISTISAEPKENRLTRWEREAEKLHHYSAADGIPESVTSAFCEDASGNLWIGFYDGQLLRYASGRFTSFTALEGLSAQLIKSLYCDRANRLWVGTLEKGVGRVDDPGADHLHFTWYTTAEGLSGSQVWSIAEDGWGRIYLATNSRLDRLDPATGRIKHYTMSDGLAANYVATIYRDRRGALWFSTHHGISRLVPEADPPPSPPPILISALRIAGDPYPVSALGAAEITGPEMQPGQNEIQIDFVGLGLATGESLRYQFKLEGSDADWSAPTEQRVVNYAKLPPGTYRFLVRAVSADGVTSDAPAAVSFRVLPPVWWRWWFMATAALVVASAVFLFARSRYQRLKALRESENRFRTLAETASDAIVTIDEDSRIVLVNRAAEKVFGYTRQEMVGAELTMLMPEYMRHLHQTGFTRYKQTGERHMSWEAVDLPGLHKDGREIPLEVSFGEFTRNGERFFTGIARDTTERKRAEEALRRSREERLAELERVRKRIATDLHDDIGSSLTRISLLSEVARRQADGAQVPLSQPLSSIARLSRELVDSMSDIVWAINPNKDYLSDLSQRMRHFASDVFTARQIDFRFRAPAAERDVKVGANVRRELFLVFKEAVNNTVRHSGCAEAEIEFRAGADGLFLKLSDNGRGFDVSGASAGHGLLSMRARTEALGGRLEVVSHPGRGTTLTFTIPLDNQQQPASAAAGGAE